MPAKLLCTEGALAGKRVLLEVGKTRKIRIGTEADAPLLTFSFAGDEWHVASDRDIVINGKNSSSSLLHHGDQLKAGQSEFKFESDDIVSVDFMAETRDESDDYEEDDEAGSAANRQRRRISASHKAVLQEPDGPKKGLLGRVGQAFRRRDERADKLEELEAQRQQVLSAAGRFTLENQGGLGLPQTVLVRLFRGEKIELTFEALLKNHIDHFRSMRDRLLFLDADIDACRIEMGLPVEDRNTLEKLHLRADKEAEEENAYQAMDAVATLENEFDLHSGSDDSQLDLNSSDENDGPETNAHNESTDEPEEETFADVRHDVHTDIIRRDKAPSSTESDEEAQANRQRQNSRRRTAGSSAAARRRRRTR